MESVSYEKKEVFHIRLKPGDSFVKIMDLACKTAGISTDDFDQFTITAISMLTDYMVELTLVYISEEW